MKHAAGVLALVMMASAANAQTRPAPRPRARINRIFVSIDGVYQTAPKDFSDSVTFQENAESGAFSTSYDVKSGPAFTLSGGGLVWQRLAVGVGVSRFSHATPTTLSGSVPHPFFFSRPRSVSGDVGGLTRTELAVHVQARAMIPVAPRMQAMVFGGPSFFQVKQDIVNDFEISESYPYDTATFSRGVTNTFSESKVGFSVGGDFTYFLTRQVGVGGTALYAGATMKAPSPDGGTIDLKIGGFQAGGGLRFRF